MKKNCTYNLKVFLLLFVISIIFQDGNAQVGINTTSPHASSILDMSSTTQGMLAPRMTTAEKLAITSPANGLLVYDTDLKQCLINQKDMCIQVRQQIF